MPSKTTDHPLARYWKKRDFDRTAEPRGDSAAGAADGGGLSFVVQKHAASRLHYDFRLELGGVLLSWAVPKGPSYDPSDKRMAIHVEDHPIDYGSFEGRIAPGQYGAGTVIVWDRGTWEPEGDPVDGLKQGKLVFMLHGQKLVGRWELVRIAKPGDRQEAWILFKKRDAQARPKSDYDVVSALPDSVIARPLATPAAAVDDADEAAAGAKASKSARATKASKPSTATKSSKGGKATTSARRSDAGGDAPAGAVRSTLPAKIKPQLATLADAVPTSGDWSCEIKFDGYRIMCRIDGGRATLFTRNGHDWSARMPDLVAEIEGLGLDTAWLDGEIVVLDDAGLPQFNALQKAFDSPKSAAVIDYFLFDLPYLEGHDLREVPLRERRVLLKAMLDDKPTTRLRYSADFGDDVTSVLQSACRMGLEGIIAKRSDAPYSSSRTTSWLKLKCRLRQEFVVAGYTDRSDGSPQIGSLLLGLHDDDGKLVSVGSVGTGWNAEQAADLKKMLAKLETDAPPFAAGASKPGRWSRRAAGSERWVRPKVVVEVQYADTTPDGQIRHAVWVGVRTDKPASAVRRETAVRPAGATPPPRAATKGAARATSVKVSHGDRIIDAASGTTKLELVRYYESVAEFMLPHLRGRPCSLVRGPEGVGGSLFFQKHDERGSIPGLKMLDADLWPGHDALFKVPTAQALASAAQMNVIEFHTWNSTDKHIDSPDRIVFDLDPGDGAKWQHLQEGATLVRGFLQELGLQSWLKTSGGKGLHVVVPIAPKRDTDSVKAFSQAVVQHLARVIPSRFVAKSGPANRVGKIFVDYLRNGFGSTTAAAFSARSRPGLGVSMPVSWDELASLKSGAQWTVATAREHLSFQTDDPWAGYWKSRQTLTAAIRKLGQEG